MCQGWIIASLHRVVCWLLPNTTCVLVPPTKREIGCLTPLNSHLFSSHLLKLIILAISPFIFGPVIVTFINSLKFLEGHRRQRSPCLPSQKFVRRFSEDTHWPIFLEVLIVPLPAQQWHSRAGHSEWQQGPWSWRVALTGWAVTPAHVCSAAKVPADRAWPLSLLSCRSPQHSCNTLLPQEKPFNANQMFPGKRSLFDRNYEWKSLCFSFCYICILWKIHGNHRTQTFNLLPGIFGINIWYLHIHPIIFVLILPTLVPQKG